MRRRCVSAAAGPSRGRLQRRRTGPPEAAARAVPPRRAADRPSRWSCRPSGSRGSRGEIWKQPAGARRADRQRRAARSLSRASPMPMRSPVSAACRAMSSSARWRGCAAVKNLPRLVRAFAAARARRAAGDRRRRAGARRDRSPRRRGRGVGDRVLLPGFLADAARYVGHFDIFALSSDSEQFPIALIEAMAAGLPVVATDVGDVCAMVAPENRRYVVPVDDEAALRRRARPPDRQPRPAPSARRRQPRGRARAHYGEAGDDRRLSRACTRPRCAAPARSAEPELTHRLT